MIEFEKKVVPAIDNLPDGWSELPVKELIEKHFCGPSPDCEERQIVTDEEWGVLKTTAVTWGGWNENAHKVLPKGHWGRTDIEVQRGDVLVTKAGPRNRVAVVANVNGDPKHLVVSGKMIGLRPRKSAVVPQFLAGAISLRKPQEYIHARTTGMAESQVNFANTVLLEMKIRVPKLDEQRRIAAMLDRLCDTIVNKEAVTTKLEQIRSGLLNDLLTRGLNSRGQLRDPIAHPEQFQPSPVGQIPKGWEAKELSSLCCHIGSGITPKGGQDVYTAAGIMLIRSQNVTFEGLLLSDVAFIPEEIHLGMLRSEVFPHDVLFNITGASIGRCCPMPVGLGQANVNQHVCALRVPKATAADAKYLASLLASPIGRKQMDSLLTVGNRQGLNYQQLGSFVIPWPKEDERKTISSQINAIETQICAEERACGKLALLKSGLMADLFTGRVRVPVTNGRE